LEGKTMSLKFEIGQKVRSTVNGDVGVVIARSEFDDSANNYCVRLTTEAGKPVDRWWLEPDLEAVAQ
jgi:heat shock protein HspQ